MQELSIPHSETWLDELHVCWIQTFDAHKITLLWWQTSHQIFLWKMGDEFAIKVQIMRNMLCIFWNNPPANWTLTNKKVHKFTVNMVYKEWWERVRNFHERRRMPQVTIHCGASSNNSQRKEYFLMEILCCVFCLRPRFTD